ncbi:MAG: translesion error-prone DNA polymerase V autoproteolytic subunit [Planctomycetaceae bacterium]
MSLLVTQIYSYDGAINYLIPLYSAVSAGFPSPADDYVETQLDLNTHLISHPAATFFVRVVGESMIDAGIESGDLLVVDKSLDAKDGDIVIASIEGQFLVKRFRRTGRKFQLIAESNGQVPIILEPDTDVEIWGVVAHVIHSPRNQRHGRRRTR